MQSFQAITAGSLVGIAALALMTTGQATQSYRLYSQTQVEKDQAENAKALADAYAAFHIATFEQLVVSDYVLSDTPPLLDWQHSVNPNKKTFIYDQYRRCVGYALQGQFYFIKHYSEACSNGQT